MINKALKQIRIFHQIKQADLASSLDISRSYLSEIESGHKSVSIDILNKYAEIFSIPTSSLLLFSENYGKSKISESFRAVCANKIVQIMEWVHAREEASKTQN